MEGDSSHKTVYKCSPAVRKYQLQFSNNSIEEKPSIIVFFDVDKEIQTLGSTMPETWFTKLVSGLSIYSQVGIFRSAMQTDDRFYLSASLGVF